MDFKYGFMYALGFTIGIGVGIYLTVADRSETDVEYRVVKYTHTEGHPWMPGEEHYDSLAECEAKAIDARSHRNEVVSCARITRVTQ